MQLAFHISYNYSRCNYKSDPNQWRFRLHLVASPLFLLISKKTCRDEQDNASTLSFPVHRFTKHSSPWTIRYASPLMKMLSVPPFVRAERAFKFVKMSRAVERCFRDAVHFRWCVITSFRKALFLRKRMVLFTTTWAQWFDEDQMMMAYDSYKPACFMLNAIEYTLCTAIIAYRRLSHYPSTVLSTQSESYVRASPQSDVDHADHQLFDKSAFMAMLRL